MCGRFTLRKENSELEEAFNLALELDRSARFNIAPTQDVLTVRESPDSGICEFVFMHWGLIPPWAPDEKIGSRMINARAETIAEKRSYKGPLQRRRCLVVADGFYEWQAEEGAKQPYFIHRQDDRPFAFAGLWEVWKRGKQPVESCTIVTTAANKFMEKLHHRMPVILAKQDYAQWLDSEQQEPEKVLPLLNPHEWRGMEAYAVSKKVNKASYNKPDCIDPIE